MFKKSGGRWRDFFENTYQRGRKIERLRNQKLFSIHSRRGPKPFSPGVFSSECDVLGTADVPKNTTSPPSQSSNLNVEPSFSPHSRPPISDLSPSSPNPSMLMFPLCETLRFSSSRSRIVFTRLAARVAEFVCDDDPVLSRSDLWARISRDGCDCDGGREVRACKRR